MIIVRLSGGMGNQMFQCALGRRLSLDRGVPLKLDLTFLLHRVKMPKVIRPHFVFRDFALDPFEIQASIAKPENIALWNRPAGKGRMMLVVNALLRRLAFLPGWEKSFRFDRNILSLGPNTYLCGLWQSYKYFESIRGILQADFQLKNPLPENVKTLESEIVGCNSVCLHVRRGDYVGNVYHDALTDDYYERAIQQLSEMHPIDRIYVFSDDIAWCKHTLSFTLPTTFVGEEYSGQGATGHFHLMRSCKYFIICNSSFSWWAAWLAESPEKIVIAPSTWFGDTTIDTTDLVPPEWFRI